MIRRLIAPYLFLIASCCLAPALQAGPDDAGLITVQTAQRYGLERAWFTQLNGTPVTGIAGNLQLQVSMQRSQTVFRVTDQRGLTISISDRNLDTFGQPYGAEGAEKAAAEKIRLLKLEGIDATVEKRVVPDITLFATTNRGVVHAINAETGRILWTTPVGQSRFPTTAAAVSDKWVAVVNGQHLYLLRAEDGELVEQRRLHGAVPAAGPVIAGDTVSVPMLSGQLFTYDFGPNDNKTAKVSYAKGLVRFPPTAIGNQVLWPTDSGVITAMDPGRPGVTYRLRLEDAVAGPLVYSPPYQLLVVTDNGYLYSFDIKTGAVKWRFSTGDRTSEPASIVGETVFLMSRDAGMHAVNATTGEDLWWAAGARRFIAATTDKVYASTNTGVMLVLDLKTGSVISEIPINPTDRVFVNNQTDRIYIGTKSGLVQCLHEQGAHWPTIHVTGSELATADAAAAKPDGGTPGEAAAQPADPFAKEPADAEAPPRDPFDKEPAADPKANPFEDDAKKAPGDEGKAEAEDMEPSGPEKSEDPFDK
jgi:outer membrane protein assembly factor BamB